MWPVVSPQPAKFATAGGGASGRGRPDSCALARSAEESEECAVARTVCLRCRCRGGRFPLPPGSSVPYARSPDPAAPPIDRARLALRACGPRAAGGAPRGHRRRRFPGLPVRDHSDDQRRAGDLDDRALTQAHARARRPGQFLADLEAELPTGSAPRQQLGAKQRLDRRQLRGAGHHAVEHLARPRLFGARGPRLVESSWYTRVDYFHWNERYHSNNIADESGPLYTLGYTRTGGDMRFRAEIFGGVATYRGFGEESNGTFLPVNGQTTYFGGRGEIDFFCNMRNHPCTLFFFGLGVRCWDRQLPSATVNGINFQGYTETWFTFYPYVGLETRYDPAKLWQFYGRTRIGVTAWNFNDAAAGGGRRNALSASRRERALGRRRALNQWLITGYLETFGWARSGSHDGYLQPQSTMITVGVKAGWIY